MFKPIVASRGSLTAISDGEVIAVYDSDFLAVSSLNLGCPIQSETDLHSALPEYPSKGLNIVNPPRLPTPTFAPLLDPIQKHSLSRLTLNISNSCNLWCSYCYADHGTYHAPVSLMSNDRAIQAVRRSLQLYSRIGTIQFFGGEPLLNSPIIDAVCNFLSQEYPTLRPEFVATTNGTLLNDDILAILRQHRVGLTISIDGPAAIHDVLRPAKGGTSSHSTILKNIERLRAEGIHLDFECTYTLKHYEMGISVCDLLDYFSDELGETNPHISWSYLPQPKLTAEPLHQSLGVFRNDIVIQARQHLPVELAATLFRAAARKSMQNIATQNGAALTFVLGILQNISSRSHASAYCPAFNSQLSIATNGDVYPCFMFIGDSRMKMGNIFNSEFPGPETKEMWENYLADFGPHATGTNAWYSALASGCIAGDYIATGGLADRLYEPVQKAMIEEVLLGIVRYAN